MNAVYNFREFQNALKRVRHAISTDEERPVLMCLHVIGTKHNTKFQAADGFRLALEKISPPQDGVTFDILLDPATVKAIADHKLTKKQDPELTLDMETGRAAVADKFLGGFSAQGMGWGTFPDVKVVIPTTIKTSFTVYPLPLLQALKSARVFSREGSNVAQLHISESLVIVGTSEITGESVSVVSTYKRTGPELLIAFNVNFLIDLLKQAGTDPVKFEFNKATSPALITFQDGMQAVIMPMSLRGDTEFRRAEDIPAAPMGPMEESYIWPGSPETPRGEWLNDRLSGKHAPIDYSDDKFCCPRSILPDDIFTSTPEPGAVEYDLTGAVYDMDINVHNFKEIKTPRITLELSNPRPIETPQAPAVVDEFQAMAEEIGVPAPDLAALFGASVVEIPTTDPEPAPIPVEMERPCRYALMDDE